MGLPREEVRRLFHVIDLRLSRAADDMSALQSQCAHPAATKKHEANTGNYDPHADCYWTDFACPDCGKYWTVDCSV